MRNIIDQQVVSYHEQPSTEKHGTREGVTARRVPVPGV